MTNKVLKDKINSYKKIVDKAMVSYFSEDYKLREALNYATDGGKRIRAILFLESLSMLGYDYSDADLNFALAIEMVHAYSLVHDDLPAMDDDDMRRGKPSLHSEFGEDIAILTGDALLNEAASLLFDLSIKNKSYLKASRKLLDYAGFRGMIEGQVLDLEAPAKPDIRYIFNVYEKKTSNLFMASMEAAAIVVGIDEDKQKSIRFFAKKLGYAFQIQDDLLEDDYKNELNILNIMNKDEALDLLDDVNQKAKDSISQFTNNEFFLELTDYLLERDK